MQRPGSSVMDLGNSSSHGKPPRRPSVTLLLPARNEAQSLPVVLSRVPKSIGQVLVVDNGSTDRTAAVARANGAEVVTESVPGYGQACLAGLARLADAPPAFVAFADADGSDGVQNLETLLAPLLAGDADLVLARRIPETSGALSPQQRFGNWLATRLIRLFWGYAYQDLGPMRALSWPALQRLEMRDRDFGWTVEMQIRALKVGLRVREVPLPYYARIAGTSKISRTGWGIVRAGSKILWVIGKEMWLGRTAPVLQPGSLRSAAHVAHPPSDGGPKE
ncbi:MAG: glycosyltransferase family 2 protein [Deferrisomatales bacterium]|nr:glycosyltransferase family 2 protein [Deferrisomatales bacterium]